MIEDDTDAVVTSRLYLDLTTTLKLWLRGSSGRSDFEFEFDLGVGQDPYFPGGQLLPLAPGRTTVKAEFPAESPGNFDEARIGRGLEREREFRDMMLPGASLTIAADGASRDLWRLRPPKCEGASTPFFTAGTSSGREGLLYFAPEALSSLRDA
mmetsp:Transcript_18824/g.39456  ORF Transcript_18824/g.39456 Transcript_18824/m.39456 type:complete len:154 (+) Transcript_18824:434-895(+)